MIHLNEKCLFQNFLQVTQNLSKSFLKVQNNPFTIKNIGRQVYREKKIGEKKHLPNEIQQEYKINFENILMSLKLKKIPTSGPIKFNSSITDSDIEIEKVKKIQILNEDTTSSEDSNEDSPVSLKRLALKSNFNESLNFSTMNFLNENVKIKSSSKNTVDAINKKFEEFEIFHLIDDSTTDLSEDDLSQSDMEFIDTLSYKSKSSKGKEKDNA